MAYARIGDLFLLVHNENTPSDDDFRTYVDEFVRRQDRLEKLRVLVITDGGAPNGRQRAWLNQALGDKSIPTAVVTSATIPRMIVTVLSLCNPKIRAFAPHEVPQALEYLGIPDTRLDAVVGEAQKLHERLA